jgi:hypothetical protein
VVVIKDLLDVDVCTEQIRTCKQNVRCSRSLMFSLNCGSNLVRLLVINMIIRAFCYVYRTDLCNKFIEQ